MNTQDTDHAKKELDELSIFLLNELKNHKQIEPSLYTEFTRLYAQRLFTDFSLSASLTKLYDYCQADYNHHFSRTSLSPSEAVSGFYSNFWLYFIYSDLKKEESYQKKLLVEFKTGNRMKILMLINNNPGIIHKQLAKEVDITPSALSQFVSKYQSYNLFSTIAAGREKAYFIESNGRSLLEKNVSEKETSDSESAETAIARELSSELKTAKSRIAELEAQLKGAVQRERDLEAQLEESAQNNKELAQLFLGSVQTPGFDSEREAEEQIIFDKQSRNPFAPKRHQAEDDLQRKDFFPYNWITDSKKTCNISNSGVKKDPDHVVGFKDLTLRWSNVN